MNRFIILTFITCFTVLLSCGKNGIIVDNYFGQSPPADIPERFAPGIVSTKYHEHSRIVFSADGTEMFWAVSYMSLKKRHQDIWFSEYKNADWSKPAVASFSEDYWCGRPVLSPDGKRFYFESDRPAVDGEKEESGGIWFVEKKENGWTEPESIPDFIKLKKHTMSVCFSRNGNLYLDQGGPVEGSNFWDWSIYCSKLENGSYSEPEELTDALDGSMYNWTPYVAPNESYIIFSSLLKENPEDYGDLYISFRKKNMTWTKPVNMGDKINSDSQERFPSVSPDGKVFFFARNTEKNHSDIFWISAKIIDELKKETFK